MALPYKAGDIELNNIILYNYKSTPVDLRRLMSEFTVYHDLMSNGMQCEILILDATGVVEMLPIVGDETVIITFRTPSFDDFRTYVFRIYKIDNKVKSNDRTDAFVLHGISQEVINDHRRSVSKSYTNLTASSIVKSIYNEYLKPNEQDHYLVKKKNLYIQDTLDNHHMVFPGEKPFTAINTMCMEAKVNNDGKLTKYDFVNKKINEEEYIDNSEASNFVFYESYDGWYFRTLDSLLTRTYQVKDKNNNTTTRDYAEDYYLTNAKIEPNNKEENSVKPYQKINSLSYEKQFDTIENMETGLYFHKVETIDPITKRFTTDVFTYNKDGKKVSHLEKNKSLFSKKSIFADDDDTTLRYYMQSNIGENYNKQSYLSGAIRTDPQIRNPRSLHKFFKYDITSRTQLNNIVLSISVPGNTDIEIGQVVNIHIPQNSGVEEYKRKINLLYGKRFFITAVRHTYNKVDNNFFTVFEAVKDTYAKGVVEETRDVIDEDE
jgi:hypothetical protein